MLEQLKLLIRSENPIVSVRTHDEAEATAIVRRAADELSLALYEWSITSGLARTRPTASEAEVPAGKAAPALDYVLEHKGESRIYLFKDLGAHCRDAYVQRRLRDAYVCPHLSVVLVDGELLPEAVRRLTVPVQLMHPDAAELEQLVTETFRSIRAKSLYEVSASLTKGDMDTLVQTLRGLTRAEAARVVATAIYTENALSAEELPRIVEAKKNLLQTAGCLESITVNFAADEIGGLDNLKAWLGKRRNGMSKKARAFGLEPPRGILLLGVQGCGKSLCAKVVAADWNIPLLRMDPGVLYQKYIGESENRLREALTQAETMAPVVLWIDEIEKAFASAAAESADGGLSQRMFGTLLSWMQDHSSPIFIVATANNIAALPPELMRKGRFDEVFFVDLPGPAARRAVLSIHLRRRKRDPEKFALDELVAATDGFSGAELENLVVSGLYNAFAARKELSTEHMWTEIKATRPLAVLMAERVQQLRTWSKGRCVPAD